MTILDNCKLTYFPLPARAESIRLALKIGGVEFEDERIAFKDWQALKPSTPWGSLPQLTLATGEVIAQQRAILRLVGKLTGLYPEDPVQAALVDSIMDACEDLGTVTNKQGQGLAQAEKEAARAKAYEEGGAVAAILKNVEGYIGRNGGSGGYSVGSSLTIADLFLFSAIGAITSGLYDGVPLDAVDTGYPNITAVRKTVRSQPAVVDWYNNLDKDIRIAPSYGPF